MRRFFWIGVGVCFGIFCWPWWSPSALSLQLGIIAFVVIILICREHWASEISICLIAFLIGSLRCSSIASPVVPEEGSIVGEVRNSKGRRAIIESEQGRIDIEFVYRMADSFMQPLGASTWSGSWCPLANAPTVDMKDDIDNSRLGPTTIPGIQDPNGYVWPPPGKQPKVSNWHMDPNISGSPAYATAYPPFEQIQLAIEQGCTLFRIPFRVVFYRFSAQDHNLSLEPLRYESVLKHGTGPLDSLVCQSRE